jgi:hypothetical protein
MSRSSRRTLLKGIALTLPAAWSAPIVRSVVLPAHAQTSGIENGIFTFQEVTARRGPLNWLVPSAYAGSCAPVVGCATLEDGVLTIFAAYDQCCCYHGSGDLDGGPISVASADTSCTDCGPYSAKVIGLKGAVGTRTLRLLIDGNQADFVEVGTGNCDCARVGQLIVP